MITRLLNEGIGCLDSKICFVCFVFVLFCFVLFCFVLFCFDLFCFVLFCFVFCLRSNGLLVPKLWSIKVREFQKVGCISVQFLYICV